MPFVCLDKMMWTKSSGECLLKSDLFSQAWGTCTNHTCICHNDPGHDWSSETSSYRLGFNFLRRVHQQRYSWTNVCGMGAEMCWRLSDEWGGSSNWSGNVFCALNIFAVLKAQISPFPFQTLDWTPQDKKRRNSQCNSRRYRLSFTDVLLSCSSHDDRRLIRSQPIAVDIGESVEDSREPFESESLRNNMETLF